jgi:hypothetical protein
MDLQKNFWERDAIRYRRQLARSGRRIEKLHETVNRLECRHPYPETPLNVSALIRARDALRTEYRFAHRCRLDLTQSLAMADLCRRQRCA